MFTRQRRLRAPTLPARYHVIDWAIEYGTLEIYDFLASKIELHHAHHFVGGRPCASAARMGNASMLRRLFDRGFAVDQLALRCVVQGFDGLNGYDGVPEAEDEEGEEKAKLGEEAEGEEEQEMEKPEILGQVDMLQLLLEKGAKLTGAILEAAVQGGRIQLVRYLLTTAKSPFDERACAAAAGMHHNIGMHMLRCLRAYHVPWGESACVAAALQSFETLKFLVKQGCLAGPMTMAAAAAEQNEAALQWLRRRGVKWDEDTTLAAAKAGNQRTLVWAVDEGCPCDVQACLAAVRSERFKQQFKPDLPWHKKSVLGRLHLVEWWLKERTEHLAACKCAECASRREQKAAEAAYGRMTKVKAEVLKVVAAHPKRTLALSEIINGVQDKFRLINVSLRVESDEKEEEVQTRRESVPNDENRGPQNPEAMDVEPLPPAAQEDGPPRVWLTCGPPTERVPSVAAVRKAIEQLSGWNPRLNKVDPLDNRFREDVYSYADGDYSDLE